MVATALPLGVTARVTVILGVTVMVRVDVSVVVAEIVRVAVGVGALRARTSTRRASR
jgi:hypothetical protein